MLFFFCSIFLLFLSILFFLKQIKFSSSSIQINAIILFVFILYLSESPSIWHKSISVDSEEKKESGQTLHTHKLMWGNREMATPNLFIISSSLQLKSRLIPNLRITTSSLDLVFDVFILGIYGMCMMMKMMK